MSLFGEQLRHAQQGSGVSVSELARLSGIERTTLHKFISGERMPKLQQVETLLQAMSLSPDEKAELLATFEVTRSGEGQFRQRQKVLSVIKDISQAYSAGLPSNDRDSVLIEPPEILRRETESLSGEFTINNLIAELISGEEHILYFSMPHDYQFFYDLLLKKHLASPKLTGNGFFSFVKAKKAYLNLNILAAIAPFLTLGDRFLAYYVYSDAERKDLFAVPFPYFIHSSRYTLLLSEGLNRAIVSKNNAIRDSFQITCMDYLEASSMLLSRGSMITQLLDDCSYSQTDDPTGGDFRIIGFDGQLSFVETGQLSMLPPDRLDPFDDEGRRRQLQKLLAEAIGNTAKVRLLNPAKLALPNGFFLANLGGRSLVLSDAYDARSTGRIIRIAESSLVGAFSDFFVNVPDSDLTFSKAETIQAIQDALRD
ncbi:MAG: helix-turn-helix domain-containing protein [Actinomycetia bacterium]|nr:helix-turn-helix domain-containing protein [Actinomycetes bacterium]